MKIMAPGPIASWQIDGEKVDAMTDFIFLGSNFTVDGDCSHKIKRCLLLGRKVMIDLDSILKIRDITLPTKVHIVKAMIFFFPVVMYTCKSWTVNKAEYWWIDVFELWCWRRLLRVLWTARRSNLSILKEISSEYSLEGCCWSSNSLAIWCEEPTHWKRFWSWQRLAKGEGGDRGLTQGTWVWANSRR